MEQARRRKKTNTKRRRVTASSFLQMFNTKKRRNTVVVEAGYRVTVNAMLILPTWQALENQPGRSIALRPG
jgi:hypothetical protein